MRSLHDVCALSISWLDRGDKKGLVEFGTDVLDEPGHDGKTAHDDTSGKLGPAPESYELQVVGFVGGCWGFGKLE